MLRVLVLIINHLKFSEINCFIRNCLTVVTIIKEATFVKNFTKSLYNAATCLFRLYNYISKDRDIIYEYSTSVFGVEMRVFP